MKIFKYLLVFFFIVNVTYQTTQCIKWCIFLMNVINGVSCDLSNKFPILLSFLSRRSSAHLFQLLEAKRRFLKLKK